jgi:G3E family GTPase
VKDDLINTLEQLAIHKDRFDYILIETTGMANPGPVISSLWTDSELGTSLRLDGVVCVVDAANISRNLMLSEVASDVRQQICYADRIIINKADLVSSEKVSL